MNPAETHALLGLLRRLRDERGLTLLLVEHDMPLVMSLCDRLTVLNFGRRIADGTPAEVRAHPAVIEPIWHRQPRGQREPGSGLVSELLAVGACASATAGPTWSTASA